MTSPGTSVPTESRCRDRVTDPRPVRLPSGAFPATVLA